MTSVGTSGLPSSRLALRQPRLQRLCRGFSYERAGRILAGLGVLLTVVLTLAHHRAWAALTLVMAANLVVSGVTDRCVVKNLLVALGLPGERDLGRAEAQADRGAPRAR